MPASGESAPWPDIRKAILETTGSKPEGGPRSVSGGCIHDTYKLESGSEARPFFVKINDTSYADSFQAEADGLDAIINSDSVLAPQPVTQGITTSGHAFLVLTFIEMGSLSSGRANELLGHQLAAMHQSLEANGKFGWHRENTIGATPQPNTSEDNWADFFCAHRLEHQFKLALESDRGFSQSEKFLSRAHEILSDHEPSPSLLHGDLWGGNAASTPDGDPVIFDPATYYGDRETDIAFTHMFGGFGRTFYQAYQDTWPLPDGYQERAEIYNLYHILNHHHLFGGGYGSQAKAVMRRFL